MATTPSAAWVTRRRLGRMLLVLAVEFVGLIILVLAFLPYLVSLESIKGQLVSQMAAALHCHVEIGAVRLHILTGVGASLEDLRIENPPGWPPQHFLTIGTLAVKVAFLPLLQGKIELRKMTVRDGDILIERSPSGQLNVADLTNATPGLAPILGIPAHQAFPAEATPSAVGPLARLRVSDLTLDGVTITFVDRMGAPGQVVTTTVGDVRGHLSDFSLTTHLDDPHPPHIQLDLRAQRLAVDRRGAKASGPAQPPPSEPANQIPPANTRLPSVTLHGTVRIAEGHSHYLSFQQLAADVTWGEGLLKSTQQANLYGGSYQGMAQMNLAPPEPAYALDARVAGVNLGEATTELTPANNLFGGALTAHIKLAGLGSTWPAIRQTLRGDGNVRITDARFTRPDSIAKLSREVTILSPLGSRTTQISVERHAFNAVEVTFHIGQGKVFSDHLQLSGKDITILAKGYVGLDRSIECNSQLVLSGQRAREHSLLATFLRDRYGRIIVPFTVQGTVGDPKVVVDATDLWRGRKAP